MNRITRGGRYLGVAMVFCAGAALLASCDAPASSGVYVAATTKWSSEHPGPTYTTISFLAPDTGKVRWQHREEWDSFHGYAGNPVVVNGIVYMVADTNTTSTDPSHPISGMLLALRASDGQQLWRTEVGGLASRPLVDGDSIFISAEHFMGNSGFSKEVYALNRGDGSVRWKTEIPNTRTLFDALVLSQGRLFISASQLCFDSCDAAYLFALDAGNGQIIWQQSFPGNLTIESNPQPPVADGGVLYIQLEGYDGRWLVLSAADGHQLWHDSTSFSHLVGGHFVSGGVIYTNKAISPPDPNRSDLWTYAVVALDGKTGMEQWQTPTDMQPEVMAVEEGQVIVRSERPNPPVSQPSSLYLDVVSAFDSSDGKLLWSAQQDVDRISVAAAAGTLYLGLPANYYDGGQDHLAALHAADGNVLWRQPFGPSHPPSGSGPLGIAVVAPPTGDLFCAVSASFLYGIRTTDGHTLWSANLSASGDLVGVTIVP